MTSHVPTFLILNVKILIIFGSVSSSKFLTKFININSIIINHLISEVIDNVMFTIKTKGLLDSPHWQYLSLSVYPIL